jgi:hypothetical protein
MLIKLAVHQLSGCPVLLYLNRATSIGRFILNRSFGENFQRKEKMYLPV